MKGFLFGDKVIVNEEVKDIVCFAKKYGKYYLLSPYCAMYLLEKGKLEIYFKDKKLTIDEAKKYFNSCINNFEIRYIVFKKLVDSGYIVGTGFKFGAEFRVYEKGVNPDNPFVHSKWICYPVCSEDYFEFHELSAKNRVAHSTRKSLLVGIVDEKDVTFLQIEWKRM